MARGKEEKDNPNRRPKRGLGMSLSSIMQEADERGSTEQGQERESHAFGLSAPQESMENQDSETEVSTETTFDMGGGATVTRMLSPELARDLKKKK
jgi:hypothetical protein